MKQSLIFSDPTLDIEPVKTILGEASQVYVTNQAELLVARVRQGLADQIVVNSALFQSIEAELSLESEEAVLFLKKLNSNLRFIIFSDNNHLRKTVELVRYGADDYFVLPTSEDEVRLVLKQVKEQEVLEARLDYYSSKAIEQEQPEELFSKSPTMKAVLDKIRSVSKTSTTILLTGETGVGKSRVARMIHNMSVRQHESFVSVHCGAIPESLVESELFGHEKGAFTSAIKRKLGRFELANRGTLFLDEIGTISASTQVKLLNVLQESLFQRVGGESDIKVDVRIIAATNEDLKLLTETKSFRSDLYFRLNVFPIEIPPLRERPEDIPLLCQHFIDSFAVKHGKNIHSISEQALSALIAYPWPGNIRELENLLERAFIIEASDVIQPESFPLEIISGSVESAVVPMDVSGTLAEVRNRAVEDVERQYLKEVLARCQGRISETAEIAGIGARQLHKLMTKYGLEKSDFKVSQGPKV